MMGRTPSKDALRYAIKAGTNATSPEQAREALVTIGDILGGTDKKKCRQISQRLEDDEVMKVCRNTAKALEKKAGLAKPWWKFWE